MTQPKMTDRHDVREEVRKRYGAAALSFLQGKSGSCCGGENGEKSSCCGTKPATTQREGTCSDSKDPVTRDLYSESEAGEIPEAALLASLGCGNPTALAELKPGETVLDLGSGGGIDVLLSARRVGPAGFAYGLDMTDEMLILAEKNRAAAGAENVKFLKGLIEDIPLPDASVDVIISNCVINLSADKDSVLREAFRVLRPGGRFAVSDVVVDGRLPERVGEDVASYVGCIAGALETNDYLSKLAATGFVEARIEPTRRYTFSDFHGSWEPKAVAELSEEERQEINGKIYSAFIRAYKPETTL